MIRPPTIITSIPPLQITCSDGHHQHDQRKHRKTPLLQQHHHYCCITVAQQSNNVPFSARRCSFRCRQCYLIPPSLMQPIIINNIKQAPPLDVRRLEIINYGWRGREWKRNDGREGWWFERVTQQSTSTKLMLLLEGRSTKQTIIYWLSTLPECTLQSGCKGRWCRGEGIIAM